MVREGKPATRYPSYSMSVRKAHILISEGYHVPAVRHRDAFYQKIEDERAAALGQK